ncbi:MAG: excisionase [Jatrophihabitans sp.]|uniref:excisionase n=1 Tax=Jatrophihabitans sp. TaxID=1932789 RepID=UPI003F7E26AD
MTREQSNTMETRRSMTVLEAAEALGIGRTLAYQLIRTNAWPTPIVRVGRVIRIPRQPFEAFLATGAYDAAG